MHGTMAAQGLRHRPGNGHPHVDAGHPSWRSLDSLRRNQVHGYGSSHQSQTMARRRLLGDGPGGTGGERCGGTGGETNAADEIAWQPPDRPVRRVGRSLDGGRAGLDRGRMHDLVGGFTDDHRCFIIPHNDDHPQVTDLSSEGFPRNDGRLSLHPAESSPHEERVRDFEPFLPRQSARITTPGSSYCRRRWSPKRRRPMLVEKGGRASVRQACPMNRSTRSGAPHF